MMHALYFALININLKPQVCANTSFSLLLILLDNDDDEGVCMLLHDGGVTKDKFSTSTSYSIPRVLCVWAGPGSREFAILIC